MRYALKNSAENSAEFFNFSLENTALSLYNIIKENFYFYKRGFEL
jgi:hypothetical protein